MPRPMFMNKEQNAQQSILSAQAAVRTEKKVYLDDPKDRERILRQKRSNRYMEFLTDLDTGNVDMKAQVNAIIEEIKKDFPLIEIPGDFIGQSFYLRYHRTFFKKTLAFSEDILYNIRSNYFALYKNTLTGIQ